MLDLFSPVDVAASVGCSDQTVHRFLEWRRGRPGPGTGHPQFLTGLEVWQFEVYWSLRGWGGQFGSVGGGRSPGEGTALREEHMRSLAERVLDCMETAPRRALWCVVLGPDGVDGASAHTSGSDACRVCWEYLGEHPGGWASVVALTSARPSGALSD